MCHFYCLQDDKTWPGQISFQILGIKRLHFLGSRGDDGINHAQMLLHSVNVLLMKFKSWAWAVAQLPFHPRAWRALLLSDCTAE